MLPTPAREDGEKITKRDVKKRKREGRGDVGTDMDERKLWERSTCEFAASVKPQGTFMRLVHVRV